jgi:hypothetical protein
VIVEMSDTRLTGHLIFEMEKERVKYLNVLNIIGGDLYVPYF